MVAEVPAASTDGAVPARALLVSVLLAPALFAPALLAPATPRARVASSRSKAQPPGINARTAQLKTNCLPPDDLDVAARLGMGDDRRILAPLNCHGHTPIRINAQGPYSGSNAADGAAPSRAQ